MSVRASRPPVRSGGVGARGMDRAGGTAVAAAWRNAHIRPGRPGGVKKNLGRGRGRPPRPATRPGWVGGAGWEADPSGRSRRQSGRRQRGRSKFMSPCHQGTWIVIAPAGQFKRTGRRNPPILSGRFRRPIRRRVLDWMYRPGPVVFGPPRRLPGDIGRYWEKSPRPGRPTVSFSVRRPGRPSRRRTRCV